MDVPDPPRPAAVTVVRVALERVAPGASEDLRLLERLGPGEIELIRTLGFAADRDRAVTARAAARLELGHRMGIHPRMVPLVGADAGDVRVTVAGTDLSISWSHSQDWVALAVAQGRPVGVDIERVPERLPVAALERIGLRSLEEFVAREAAGKVTGAGLTGDWPAAVTVRSLKAPEGYLAAAAAAGDDWTVDQVPLAAPEPPASASAVATGAWELEPLISARSLQR